MSNVLKALGITSTTKKDYNTQFGIKLNKFTLQEIVDDKSAQLLSTAMESSSSAIETISLEQLHNDFDIVKGETDMLVIAMPDMPPQNPVLVSQIVSKGQINEKLDGTIGVCFKVFNKGYIDGGVDRVEEPDGWSSLDVRGLAFNNWAVMPGQESSWNVDFEKASVKLLQAPKHGQLSARLYSGNDIAYHPNSNYAGNDKAIFLVNIEGHFVKVVYYFKVETNMEKYYKNSDKYCPNPSWWKISSNLSSGTSDFTKWQATASLNALLANASYSLSGFSDLVGSAVGETTGQGLNAQITLDSNAAGHGWFIDDTPDNNDEFLPTADPEVWIAKAGTAAAGKMDMLSVLLHEYGHALGIEQSGDNADYMAASLQPGQRRLPSTEELSLMSRLVAALKGGTDDPNDPMNPNLPLSSLGLMALCRIRRADYGWTLGVDKAQLVSRVDVNNLLQNANQPAQLQTVVNSTLNQDSSAWQTTGSIDNITGVRSII